MPGLGAYAALAAVIFIVGCASSSEEAPPAAEGDATLPDGSKYVVDLTDDEALALCQWESERLHYGNCLDDAILLSRSRSCSDFLASCTAPDAVASVLLECVAGTRDEAQSCDTTVAERLKCDLDLKQQYDAMPPCDRVTDQAIREVLYRMSPASCIVLRCP
jgi:hypothetical protein